MPPISFGVTSNGYPTVRIAAPFDSFGEFLRAEHSIPRAEHLLETVKRVVSGQLSEAVVLQDCGKLTLDRGTGTAKVWIDYLSKGTEVECEMPIVEFSDIASAWLHFIEAPRRESIPA